MKSETVNVSSALQVLWIWPAQSIKLDGSNRGLKLTWAVDIGSAAGGLFTTVMPYTEPPLCVH